MALDLPTSPSQHALNELKHQETASDTESEELNPVEDESVEFVPQNFEDAPPSQAVPAISADELFYDTAAGNEVELTYSETDTSPVPEIVADEIIYNEKDSAPDTPVFGDEAEPEEFVEQEPVEAEEFVDETSAPDTPVFGDEAEPEEFVDHEAINEENSALDTPVFGDEAEPEEFVDHEAINEENSALDTPVFGDEAEPEEFVDHEVINEENSAPDTPVFGDEFALDDMEPETDEIKAEFTVPEECDELNATPDEIEAETKDAVRVLAEVPISPVPVEHQLMDESDEETPMTVESDPTENNPIEAATLFSAVSMFNKKLSLLQQRAQEAANEATDRYQEACTSVAQKAKELSSPSTEKKSCVSLNDAAAASKEPLLDTESRTFFSAVSVNFTTFQKRAQDAATEASGRYHEAYSTVAQRAQVASQKAHAASTIVAERAQKASASVAQKAHEASGKIATEASKTKERTNSWSAQAASMFGKTFSKTDSTASNDKDEAPIRPTNFSSAFRRGDKGDEKEEESSGKKWKIETPMLRIKNLGLAFQRPVAATKSKSCPGEPSTTISKKTNSQVESPDLKAQAKPNFTSWFRQNF